MKIKVGEEPVVDEKTEEVDELPGNDGGDQPIADETPKDLSERLRQSELERARLEGEVRARREINSAPTVSKDSGAQVKQQVWADMNSMSDEDFEAKWKTKKYLATAALAEQDSVQHRQQIAELRAENRLSAKYRDYFEVKDAINDVVASASPEVRQDPDKLAKLMETAYLAATRDKKPEPRAAGGSVNRARITNAFETPTKKTEPEPKKVETDELSEEYRAIGAAFGIESEKERQRLMASHVVEMDLGNGSIFDGKRVVKKSGVA